MGELRIGIVGGGYMGKAHAVAFSAVKAVFDTPLTPRLEMVAASTPESAARHAAAYGARRAAASWEALVDDPEVDAVVVATPSPTHRPIVERAAAAGKPILCEKPLGGSWEDAVAMCRAVEAAGVVAQVGYNYVRTPATQHARRLVAEGAIGRITFARFEHTEDFFSDPDLWHWRADGASNGTLGDLACHPINAMLAFMGMPGALSAELSTVHSSRGGRPVTNDDAVQMMLRWPDTEAGPGARGHLHASRVATGRVMGYAYDLYGTEGSIRFDGEDQNALWLHRREGPEATRGFTRILSGPAHPDYEPFCQGPGHGTGYGDQITIEAKDFLHAVHAGHATFPTFRDGLDVARVCAAARSADARGTWVDPMEVPE